MNWDYYCWIVVDRKHFKNYKNIQSTNDTTEDLNYSFLTKTFSKLSKDEKMKILQVLRNTESLDKTG